MKKVFMALVLMPLMALAGTLSFEAESSNPSVAGGLWIEAVAAEDSVVGGESLTKRLNAGITTFLNGARPVSSFTQIKQVPFCCCAIKTTGLQTSLVTVDFEVETPSGVFTESMQRTKSTTTNCIFGFFGMPALINLKAGTYTLRATASADGCRPVTTAIKFTVKGIGRTIGNSLGSLTDDIVWGVARYSVQGEDAWIGESIDSVATTCLGSNESAQLLVQCDRPTYVEYIASVVGDGDELSVTITANGASPYRQNLSSTMSCYAVVAGEGGRDGGTILWQYKRGSSKLLLRDLHVAELLNFRCYDVIQVSFDSAGGGEVRPIFAVCSHAYNAIQQFPENGPTPPKSKNGEKYEFEGWYNGEGVRVTGSSMVPEYSDDHTLTARWKVSDDEKPDLYISSASASPMTIMLSERTAIKYTLVNGGKKSVGQVVTRFVADTYWTSLGNGPLAAGAYETSTKHISGRELGLGAHQICIQADAPNDVEESNEGNNSYIVTVVVVNDSPQPYVPSEQTVRVFFDPDGGKVDTTSYEYTIGSAYGWFPTPTRDGYVFQGWSQNRNGNVFKSTSDIVLADVLTLYAVWTPLVEAPSVPMGVMATDGSYTDYVQVTWSAVSGAISYNIYRSTTTSRPSTATKTGVTSPYNDTTATPGAKYYYWVSAVNSAGISYSAYDTGYRAVSLMLGKSSDAYETSGGSGRVSVTANTSWSAFTDANWITFGTRSANGNGTLTYIVDANTSSSSRSGTITVTAGSGTSYPVTKTITVLQGAAAPTTYTVSFNANGGAGTMANQVITYGVSTALNPNTFTRDGYIFSGWSKTAGGLVAYDDGALVSNLAAAGGSVTLYAVWTAVSSDFEIANGVLVRYKGAGGAVTIPKGVTSIGQYAFYGCDGLTSVMIPSSVTSIGEGAFEYCSSLTSVTIPTSVTSIGEWAFSCCSGLTSVTIPSGVTIIGRCAFSECKSLETIYVDRGDKDRIRELLTSSGFNVSNVEFRLEVGLDDRYEFLPGAQVSIDTGLIGYRVSGLPTGLKYASSTGLITGSSSTPTGDAGKKVTFTKSGEETFTTIIVIGEKPTISVRLVGDAEGCKVTGAGGYAVNAKATLKATAPKGTAFVGYYKDGAEWPNATDYNKTSITYVMDKKSVQIEARFEKEKMTVGCVGLAEGEFQVGLAGSSSGIPLEITTQSGIKSVSVSQLPTGMKYDSKNRLITGAPTKAGEYDVAITVTAVSGAVEKKTIRVSVSPMPGAAVGSFNGFVRNDDDEAIGTMQLTSTDAGKITAKVITSKGSYSFSSSYWDSVDEGEYFANMTTKKGERLELALDTEAPWNEDALVGRFYPANSYYGYNAEAHRNVLSGKWYFKVSGGNDVDGWGFSATDDAKAAGITITLKADGTVSASGKIGSYKVSASGTANFERIGEGMIIADFAPIITVSKVKTALAITVNLWLDRLLDHAEIGGAKLTE